MNIYFFALFIFIWKVVDLTNFFLTLTQIQEKFKHWSKSFENAFQGQNYEAALTCIQRMTYYKRVNEEIVKKL